MEDSRLVKIGNICGLLSLGLAAVSIPLGKYQCYIKYEKACQYADVNHNGLELDEKADVYHRMGFKGSFKDSTGKDHFPHYNLDDIEKAIKSYEEEKAAQQKKLPEAMDIKPGSY